MNLRVDIVTSKQFEDFAKTYVPSLKDFWHVKHEFKDLSSFKESNNEVNCYSDKRIEFSKKYFHISIPSMFFPNSLLDLNLIESIPPWLRSKTPRDAVKVSLLFIASLLKTYPPHEYYIYY